MSANSLAQTALKGRLFSGDGTIDESEFKSLCVSYGLSSEESAEAYNKFTSVSSFNSLHSVVVHLKLQITVHQCQHMVY
jgi:hypothetical protein